MERSILFTGDTVGCRLSDPDDACKDAAYRGHFHFQHLVLDVYRNAERGARLGGDDKVTHTLGSRLSLLEAWVAEPSAVKHRKTEAH